MPCRPTIAPLQPIAAETPLASVLNRWLVALAPAEALTRTGRKSAARAYLQHVTHSLHHYHAALTESARVLCLGLPTGSLEEYCIDSPGKPSICVPLARPLAALGLAALAAKLPTSTSVGLALAHSDHYMRRAIAASGDFAETANQAKTLLEAGRIIGLGLLGRNELTSDELLGLIEKVLTAESVSRPQTDSAGNSNVKPSAL